MIITNAHTHFCWTQAAARNRDHLTRFQHWEKNLSKPFRKTSTRENTTTSPSTIPRCVYVFRSLARSLASIPRFQSFFSALGFRATSPRQRLKFTISRSSRYACVRRWWDRFGKNRLPRIVRGRLAVRINTSREYICETVKSVSNFLSPPWNELPTFRISRAG